MPNDQSARIEKAQACPDCLRPKEQCVCGKVEAFPARLKVLILQHPREQYKLWNSARLLHMALPGSILRVGLSWPNLAKAAGMPVESSRWAVLYLKESRLTRPVQAFSRKGEPLTAVPPLDGLVVLDGSWKQSRALWWRNPWLTRLTRVALDFGRISSRRQSKAAGLSTLEAAAHALSALGEDPATEAGLLRQYRDFIVAPNSATPGLS